MQKITPFLWFNTQAEEAASFYVSVFKNAKITQVFRQPDGSAMTVAFELDGQKFVALNGGPQFTFSPAVSFVINCETQQEIDGLWKNLSENGGQEQQCGWLQDKYGISWQVVPAVLPQLLGDPAKGGKVMQALMQMKKIDIKMLEAA